MKEQTIVHLGSTQEKDSPVRVPAFFIVRPAHSKRQVPNEELLVSLNLPLDQVNKESEIFNRFVTLWEEYAHESGYKFDYDKDLYKKTGNIWQVIED
ncbi:MAG: hypothetical protein IT477_10940 [Rhodanobacteraceae bacterium]|nr:hypothetical protein [Rhodanobacteraceae bacterium]